LGKKQNYMLKTLEQNKKILAGIAYGNTIKIAGAIVLCSGVIT